MGEELVYKTIPVGRKTIMHDDKSGLTLETHDERSDQRADDIKHTVRKVSDKINFFNKGDSMDSIAAVLPSILAAQKDGSGSVGAGALGFVAGTVLGNRGGLLNGNNGVDGGFVTPAQLTTALNGVTDTLQNTAILQGLSDTKSAIPLAEAQTQIAIAAAQSDIIAQANLNQATNTAGQGAISRDIGASVASALAGQNNINQNVTLQGQANLAATKEAQFASQIAVSNSTKEILAALNEQNTATLQRQLAVAEIALAESRAVAREQANVITITNTNTATATAISQQSQMQQQLQILAQLTATVNNLQGDIQQVKQSQSNINFGYQSGTSQGQQATNNRVS